MTTEKRLSLAQQIAVTFGGTVHITLSRSLSLCNRPRERIPYNNILTSFLSASLSLSLSLSPSPSSPYKIFVFVIIPNSRPPDLPRGLSLSLSLHVRRPTV